MTTPRPPSGLFDTIPRRGDQKPGHTSVGTAPSRESASDSYINRDALWSGGDKRQVPQGLRDWASGAEGSGGQEGSAGGSGDDGGRGGGRGWGRGYTVGERGEKRDWNEAKERLWAMIEEMEQMDSVFERIRYLKNVARKYCERVEQMKREVTAGYEFGATGTRETAFLVLYDRIREQDLEVLHPEPVHSLFLYFDGVMEKDGKGMEYLKREAKQALGIGLVQ